MPVDFILWILVVGALVPFFWAIVRPSSKKIKRALIIELAVGVLFFLVYVLPVQHMERLARNGDTNAQYWLSKWYKSRFDYLWPDHRKSVYWLQKAVDGGNPYAMEELAWRYEFGVGVNRDPEKARELYSAASRLGAVDAKQLRQELERGAKNDE